MTYEKADLSDWSARKYALFAALTVVLGVALAFAVIEGLLRYQHSGVAASEYMDPGLVLFDPVLGWKLAPGWQGSHRHHDFAVEYALAMSGFRFDPNFRDRRPNMVVLGDSFTFGLGVGDGETFVSRLNAQGPGAGRYLNRGVVGYSTDQEYLLFQQTLATQQQRDVLLVTYLANDLFDNQLAFPMQADHAKPFYRLSFDGHLVLENTPVPLASKPAPAREASLAEIVLGKGQRRAPMLTRALGDLLVFQRIGILQEQSAIGGEYFAQRFREPVELYLALIGELRNAVVRSNGRLWVALLPGASFVNTPGSLSTQYQDHLRRTLSHELEVRWGVPVIDAALPLRQLGQHSNRILYFPNDGHLTADGHAAMAELLTEGFSSLPAR